MDRPEKTKPKSRGPKTATKSTKAPPKPSTKVPKTEKETAEEPDMQEPAVKEPIVKEPVEEDATGAAEKVEKPVRAKKVTSLDIAIAKYQDNGWKVIKPAKGGLNDFIASRGTRIHFVQVVTKSTIGDAKYHGEAKNNFVQNAFSNSAIPIFAHVVEGAKPKVTFEDVNTGNRAIVSARSTKTPGDK